MKLSIYLILVTTCFNLNAQITISEILYEQPTWDTNLQYFELHNYSDSIVDISNWSLIGDINLKTFPPVELLPDEHYLISNDAIGLYDFGIIMAQWAVGEQISENPLFILKDPDGNEVAKIDFNQGLDWPEPTAGVSVELCDPLMNTNDGLNWALSDNSITSNGDELSGTPADQNSCSQPPTSIANVSIGNKVKIYPNPFTSSLNIDSAIEIKSISIYSLRGTKLLHTSKLEKMDFSLLKNGIYFIEVKTNENIQFQRIIKQ